MNANTFSWILYLGGTALILGGYLGIVTPQVSWIGWVMGMLGWVMQYLPGVRDRSPARRIQEYAELRDQGLISEEEFERQKASLLASDRPAEK